MLKFCKLFSIFVCLFFKSLQGFVNKHLSKLNLEVADLDSQVQIFKH